MVIKTRKSCKRVSWWNTNNSQQVFWNSRASRLFRCGMIWDLSWKISFFSIVIERLIYHFSPRFVFRHSLRVWKSNNGLKWVKLTCKPNSICHGKLHRVTRNAWGSHKGSGEVGDSPQSTPSRAEVYSKIKGRDIISKRENTGSTNMVMKLPNTNRNSKQTILLKQTLTLPHDPALHCL